MSDGNSTAISSPSTSEDASTISTTPQSEKEEQNLMKFDLSDPNDLENKLQYLTEDEMDELLKQAYQVNGELKRELERQEIEDSSTALGAGITRSAAQSDRLPPLRVPNEKSARRGFTSLGHKPTAFNLYSSPVVSNRQKARTVVMTPAKPKPEWNDRFGV